MKHEDLIKKLETADLPDFELSSHKAKLRQVLMNPRHYQKPGILAIFKKSLIFAPALAVLVVLGFVFAGPKLAEAKALRIAGSDLEVKKLLSESNMSMKDVKVQDGKAFILISAAAVPVEKEAVLLKMARNQNGNGALRSMEQGAVIEVDLKMKKVSRIKGIVSEDVAPLVDEEKEDAKDIIEKADVIREVIPKEAKIEEIKPVFPKELKLIEKDKEVKAVPLPNAKKRATVKYSNDGKNWTVQVNLNEKTIENIRILEKD